MQPVGDPPHGLAHLLRLVRVVERAAAVGQQDQCARHAARIHGGRAVKPFGETEQAFPPPEHRRAADRHGGAEPGSWRKLGVPHEPPQGSGDAPPGVETGKLRRAEAQVVEGFRGPPVGEPAIQAPVAQADPEPAPKANRCDALIGRARIPPGNREVQVLHFDEPGDAGCLDTVSPGA